MKLEKIIADISELMDNAIEEFNKGMAGSQEKLYEKLENLLKSELETNGGKISATGANYKLLGKLNSEIINTILNEQYLDATQRYFEVYDKVAR